MGHGVRVLAGELEGPVDGVTLLPELAFSHPDCVRGQQDAFFLQRADESELIERLKREADTIAAGILEWIRCDAIDVLLTENATALPCHLSMGMALERVLAKSGIRALAHDHDFYWERGDRYATRYQTVRKIIEECFPPNLPNLRHAVINSECQRRLREDLGIESDVVPNVMDFDAHFGQRDVYNDALRSQLGLDDDAVLLFQITRIVRRKGIETAIDLVHRLDDARVRLVVTGNSTDDFQDEYRHELEHRVARLGLARQVLFAGERFGNDRGSDALGRPVFSISDAYAGATACTYFSTYEGFGNAFVEAVVAKKPILVNNYRPVYWGDIGSKGFLTVQIEGSELTQDALGAVRELIDSPEMRRAWSEHNFELGRRHFSYAVLAEKLEALLVW